MKIQTEFLRLLFITRQTDPVQVSPEIELQTGKRINFAMVLAGFPRMPSSRAG